MGSALATEQYQTVLEAVLELLKKAVSAIPVGLKCETRCSCYSHTQKIVLLYILWWVPTLSVTVSNGFLRCPSR
jgi:hypothetical protein